MDIAPPPLFFRTVKAHRDKQLGYAPSPGITEHVAAWTQYYRTRNIALKPEHILPTVGCAEAMLFALLAVADAGDEILVFESLYASYKSFAAMVNVKLVPVTLRFDDNFALPSDAEIAKKITKKPKRLLSSTRVTRREPCGVKRVTADCGGS